MEAIRAKMPKHKWVAFKEELENQEDEGKKEELVQESVKEEPKCEKQGLNYDSDCSVPGTNGNEASFSSCEFNIAAKPSFEIRDENMEPIKLKGSKDPDIELSPSCLNLAKNEKIYGSGGKHIDHDFTTMLNEVTPFQELN